MISNQSEIQLFTLDGYSIRRLRVEDAAELQDLYERCTDYHEMHEGFATRPTAGADELALLPPGKQMADKFSIGIYESIGCLIGYLDIIRNYPAANAWWIGLLMLDPKNRAKNLGSRICATTEKWVASQDGHSIHLAVLEENIRAQQFWRKQGFEELRRQPHTSETGNKTC
jgi:ribosomal protein S18 acetylase RimI-like enzyme